ncbi:unnamed protein product [Ceutorhynchus assimilis]|uniref:Caspase family p20 domain-containing protein n=1 Tax=Ceutorhynchus assimilis TaxID=467358 RepID=A0A9N9MG82_9CUCU|nr:unnamed protein product [Ceutorhynchus assimilis]
MAQRDDNKRKQSVSDLELIEFKPPIDLIPDEFVRSSNENVLVELICAGNDSEAHLLGDVLSNYGFSVSKTDRDKEKLDIIRPDEKWISNVQTKIKAKDCDGIIMIFAKVAYSSRDMKLIWSKFTTKHCPELKNKPKIFIFQTVKIVDSDVVMVLPHGRTAYDTPAEADLLIIYDRYDEDRADLLDQLKYSIENYGDQEDLITLASFGYGYDYQPLIISTMTRKFFVKIHIYRGHHLEYFTKHELVKRHISKLKESSVEKHPEKNETSSIFRSIKKKFSFRKKRDDHKSESSSRSSTLSYREIMKSDQNNVKESATEIENQTTNIEQKQETLKAATPILKSRPQKPSTSKETEIRKSKRVSTASSNSGDRPAWKP